MPDYIPEQDPLPLDDVNSIDALNEKLNEQADESVVVLAINSIEGAGGAGINQITYALDAHAGELKPLKAVAVPPQASAQDATPEANQAARAAFVSFIAPLLDTAVALCRSEVFINQTKVEIVLLRGADPFQPRGVPSAQLDPPPPPPAPPAGGSQPAPPAPPIAGTSGTFTDFMPFIFEWEGEQYENVPGDPGGPTKYGIDKRSHPNVDIPNLTKDQATQIYWQEWQSDGCTALTPHYAEVFFNCAVNMGLGRARSFDKVTHGDASHFLDAQEAYYRRLAQSPNFAKFLKGWLNRTRALRSRFNL